MDDQIKQIAERLRGLRDVLELTLPKTSPVIARFQRKNIASRKREITTFQ